MCNISVWMSSVYFQSFFFYVFIVLSFYPCSNQPTAGLAWDCMRPEWRHVAWWWQVNHRKSVNMSVKAPKLEDNWTWLFPGWLKATQAPARQCPSLPPHTPSSPRSVNYTIKKGNPPTVRSVSSAILLLPSSPCYLWRSRRGHWANLVFIVQLAASRNASPPPPTQFSITVRAQPYMSSSPVSPFMAIGGQQGFEILPGRAILKANSQIRVARVWCTQECGSAER